MENRKGNKKIYTDLQPIKLNVEKEMFDLIEKICSQEKISKTSYIRKLINDDLKSRSNQL